MAVGTSQTGAARLPLLGLVPNQQVFGLMIGIAAILALVAAAWMWGQSSDYRVLYTNLSDRDGGAIITSLQQMNVPYKFADGGGALLVPANQVHEMRLRLAGQGLPKGGLVGFELMESQKLGTSQFQEQVNYQRALEGELARSIQALSAVQAARVHLAISKPSVFVREQQKPSASIMLNLHPGRSLDVTQVSAIVHLVSSSIPDLPVKNVNIIDQNGNLLTTQTGNELGLAPGQLKYLHEVEQSFVKRIESIITPISGMGNVLAQVTADMDFTQTENVAETYTPNQSAPGAMRSQQLSEAGGGGASAPASGIPGALTNQPAANATAPVTGTPAAAQPGAATQTAQSGAASGGRRDSTVNYEVDKTIRHTRQPVGTIKRLSVAVVVNHRKQVDTEGKVTTKPLEAAELEQINALVKEVMGYNKERGDSLNVTNSAFSLPEVEPATEVPLWKQPETIATAKDIGRNVLIAGIVLFLVLGVLRPVLTKLSEAVPAPVYIPAAEQAAAAGQQQSGFDDNLTAVKQMARQEPQIVANVVKDWVAGNE
ncbi:MAG: flagellar basal-body MS-ring/collar protein FliF [Proteobacteria bacterium]|nr:flagellar basal-body MS-ring/collar protein FliF [Pseudomonadota bacterium]